jgi:geranylgeranyl diphosphate synthase type I
VTGKPAGDDLREGKRTVLVALAYRSASESDRERLRNGLGRPDLEQQEIDAIRSILESTGALAEVERRIEALSASTEEILARGPHGTGDTAVLRALLESAVRRTA